MLETDEVDDDYFTPVAKTSLASIFKKPLPDDKAVNETLKYSPPASKPILKQEESQTKRTAENIFSCVFDAYIWLDNVYTHKGKLGCAIVKLGIDVTHAAHIILYDTKKSTVSSAPTTKELEVRVKGKDFISYYDRFGKYWCLYGSEDDIKRITDILKTYNVNITSSDESDNVLTAQNKHETNDVDLSSPAEGCIDFDQNKTDIPDTNIKKEGIKSIGSDTDSSINKKTKASILNRMANMGQSVLPPRSIVKEQTDSSDTNESDSHIMKLRPKPVKSIVKKNISEKNMLENQRRTDAHKKDVVSRELQPAENIMTHHVGDQLIPVKNASILTSTPANDLNFFITEQRINNSELRINMTRVADKVDHVLNKINTFEIGDKTNASASINTEILQKLLNEYESKIKIYEEQLKNVYPPPLRSLPSKDLLSKPENETMMNELLMLRSKVVELNQSIKLKNEQISQLNNEILCLKEIKNSQFQCTQPDENEHLRKISELEQELLTKHDMLQKVSTKNYELQKIATGDDMANKIKTIMNDTFQAIAANFDDNEIYSGETLKSVVATVIKKVTIESLKQSK